MARRDDREYRAIFEGGATQQAGMHRWPNAAGLLPRAVNQGARKDARAFGSRRDRRLSRHTYGRPAGTTKTRSPRRNTKKICSVGETKKNVFFVFFVDLRAFVVA